MTAKQIFELSPVTWANTTKIKPVRVERVIVAHKEHAYVVERVLEKVSRYFKVSKEDIKGPLRFPEIVVARHLCMYFIRKNSCMKDKEIAEIFNRERSSMTHAVLHIRNLIYSDPVVRRQVKELEAMI